MLDLILTILKTPYNEKSDEKLDSERYKLLERSNSAFSSDSGLGKVFKKATRYSLANDAFEIAGEEEKEGTVPTARIKNVCKLLELANQYQKDFTYTYTDAKNKKHDIKQNSNADKRALCLAFIIQKNGPKQTGATETAKATLIEYLKTKNKNDVKAIMQILAPADLEEKLDHPNGDIPDRGALLGAQPRSDDNPPPPHAYPNGAVPPSIPMKLNTVNDLLEILSKIEKKEKKVERYSAAINGELPLKELSILFDLIKEAKQGDEKMTGAFCAKDGPNFLFIVDTVKHLLRAAILTQLFPNGQNDNAKTQKLYFIGQLPQLNLNVLAYIFDYTQEVQNDEVNEPLFEKIRSSGCCGGNTSHWVAIRHAIKDELRHQLSELITAQKGTGQAPLSAESLERYRKICGEKSGRFFSRMNPFSKAASLPLFNAEFQEISAPGKNKA